MESRKVLTLDTARPQAVSVDFRLRDAVVEKALKYKAALASGQKPANISFDEVILFNIGDAHASGQKPITFYRQVLALVAYPDLLHSPAAASFPPDVVDRAKALLKASLGLGAYSGAQGMQYVRERVASFITQRDGVPCDPANIILTDGSYDAAKLALELIIRGPSDGILAPIPQYPLYTALIAELGGMQVKYELDEEAHFQPNVATLSATLERARSAGIEVRAIIINNPGNPAGQMLSRKTIEELIRFCESQRLIIIADEVYQVNAYFPAERPFISFRHAAHALGSNVEIFSMHSTSKGFSAECGERGGYLEMYNIHPDIVKLATRLVSVRLSPNTTGQMIMEMQCNPPREGDPSYPLFHRESTDIMTSLARKAAMIVDYCNNKMTNVSCSPVHGCLFAFPRIHLSRRAIEAAKSAGLPPDTFYAEKLLDATGVCVSSGNIFGQKEGTYHIRLTLMPSEDKVAKALEKMRVFNEQFHREYAE